MINKNSSTYFIGFFTVVIFGFILMLNFVNENLKEQIQQAKTQEINTLLKQNMLCQNFIKSNIDDQEFFYCKNSNIIALHSFSKGYIDKIEYLALINTKTSFIKHISIINHKETPGLGDKIDNESWLFTIYNKAQDLLKIKKHGGQIDSFTAASVTPIYFLRNLNNDINWLEKNKPLINSTIMQ